MGLRVKFWDGSKRGLVTGRRVQINGDKSDWARVASGVSQGSVLGLLLFIIYINNLDCGFTSDISKYTDGTIHTLMLMYLGRSQLVCMRWPTNRWCSSTSTNAPFYAVSLEKNDPKSNYTLNNSYWQVVLRKEFRWACELWPTQKSLYYHQKRPKLSRILFREA